MRNGKAAASGASLVAHVSAPGNAGATGTTAPIDTTGANLLIAVVPAYAVTGTLTDSNNNAWTAIVSEGTGALALVMYYCTAPVVGPGHTFTSTAEQAPLIVQAFAGVAPGDSFDQASANCNSNPAGAIQPGPIAIPTPRLVVTGVAIGANIVSVDSDFAITDNTAYASGIAVAGGAAWQMAGAIGQLNPSWIAAAISSDGAIAGMLSFRVQGITDTQSYSQVIRDSMFAVLVQLPFFAGFKARRSKQLPVLQPLLPYLGVYIIGEDMGPDGDINAGDIRFIHSLRIGFQVIIENNDPVASELNLDAAFWAIMYGLWADDYLTNMIASGMPDNTRIEGVERGTRKHVWGTSSNGEMPIGELEYVATMRFRTEWFPTGFPDLLDIHVEAVPLAADGTAPPSTEVQRIIAEYEFTPEITTPVKAYRALSK
ncbi:MAG TPA: hypothetical protein VGI65_16840 [Steroidobacteraceae bacterium]